MTPAEVRRLELAIQRVETELSKKIEAVQRDVQRAANFQVGFQAVSKVLTYACGVALAIAASYEAFIR